MSKIVCIDVGHGGNDPGAVFGSVLEKNIVLDISLYQKMRFQSLGIKTVLTRDLDITLDRPKRLSIINNSGADVCISNHINAGGGTGAETIYSIIHKDTFAKKVLDELVNAGMTRRRAFTRPSTVRAGRDYYFIIDSTRERTEPIIVEYGFIDNAGDRAKLLDIDFRYKLAEGVVKAVCEYLGVKYLAENKGIIIEGIEAPILHNKRTMVEIRTLIEQVLGGKILTWDAKTQTATCRVHTKEGERIVIFQIGNKNIVVQEV